MKSLITIVQETNNIETMLLESQGELTPEIESALSVNETDMAAKIDSYSYILDRFAALEKHYYDKANFFVEVAKRCGSVQERLKNNVKYSMQALGKTELLGEDIKFTLKPTAGSLNIIDEEMIPVSYKSEKLVTEINKKTLKDDIAKGAVVPGAEIKPGFSLKIVANTPDKKSKTKELPSV